MGLLSLLKMPDWKTAPSKKILIFEEITSKDCYGATDRTFHRIDALGSHIPRRIAQSIDPFRHHLVVSCSLNGRHIPMLDCDSIENLQKAKSRFESKNVKHAIIESSPGHYWLFPDMSFCDFSSAWETTSHIPGCDKKYLEFAKQQSVYFVRGEPKSLQYPPSIAYNACVEPNVTSFLEQLMRLFSNKWIHAVVNVKSMEGALSD